jgi:hypothetical protein
MYLKSGDIISGKEGTVTAEIDGNVEVMFYVKNLEATFEKQKSEVNVLGFRGTQHKTVGWTGSGSMTIFYATSSFRKMAEKYAKTGEDTYFTITVTNNDRTSSIGTQTSVLYRCNLDSTVIAKMDVDNTELDEDVDFTFDDFAILEEFTMPTLIE